MYKILIVEDDLEIREELKILLKNSGYEIETITNFEDTENQILLPLDFIRYKFTPKKRI